jgi:transcriptional regulator with XRE-family HTH domain
MARTKPWTIYRKLSLWLDDQGLDDSVFAKKAGLNPRNFHGWLRQERRFPADALVNIARATKIPMAYWLDDTLPYPVPLEYGNLQERLEAALRTRSTDELRGLVELLEHPDPVDLRRTLALRRAAQEGGAPTQRHRP